jgi:hypothetical protein
MRLTRRSGIILVIVGLFCLLAGTCLFLCRRPAAVSEQQLSDAQISRSIDRGLKERIVFVDAYHADEPADLSVFYHLELKAYISRRDLVKQQDKLFRSGLLLMNYGMGKKLLSEREYAIVGRFINNGGRVMLLCPAWVWTSYEKKPLKDLPYNRIAGHFGLALTDKNAVRPFHLADPALKVEGVAKDLSGEFSTILYDRARLILIDAHDQAAAVAAQKGQARIVVWGQNNLLGEFSFRSRNRRFIQKLFNWLLE